MVFLLLLLCFICLVLVLEVSDLFILQAPFKRERADVMQSPSKTGAAQEPVSLTVEAEEISSSEALWFPD